MNQLKSMFNIPAEDYEEAYKIFDDKFKSEEKERIIIKVQKMFCNVKVARGLTFSISIMNRLEEFRKDRVYEKITNQTI